MKYIIIFIVACFISACKGDAKESTKDGDFTIELIFEKDGCKMYRFRDAGDFIYWSNCEGRTEYEKTVSTGKTTVIKRHQLITTE
jgi:hypothetical protein